MAGIGIRTQRPSDLRSFLRTFSFSTDCQINTDGTNRQFQYTSSTHLYNERRLSLSVPHCCRLPPLPTVYRAYQGMIRIGE